MKSVGIKVNNTPSTAITAIEAKASLQLIHCTT